MLGYWDTVADRLFKIRHCMNIEGVVRPLALFDPPIDPGMLVKAAAAGIDISSIVNGLNQPIGPVRCPDPDSEGAGALQRGARPRQCAARRAGKGRRRAPGAAAPGPRGSDPEDGAGSALSAVEIGAGGNHLAAHQPRDRAGAASTTTSDCSVFRQIRTRRIHCRSISRLDDRS